MGAMGVEGHGGRVERGKGGASGAGGRACTGAVCHLIGSRGIGPGDHGAMGPGGVGRRSMDTLGAMAPGAVRLWRHRSMQAMGVEAMGPWRHGSGGHAIRGHGMEGGANRADGAGGHALGPFKVI